MWHKDWMQISGNSNPFFFLIADDVIGARRLSTWAVALYSTFNYIKNDFVGHSAQGPLPLRCRALACARLRAELIRFG